MPVIVTGAGGFVGRMLLELLLAEGQPVVALDTKLDNLPLDPMLRAVEGDIANPAVTERAFAEGCTAVVHLATVPGGAAEADPALSRKINIEAMYDLLERAKITGRAPRVVYASSIAVLGEPLPETGVDDQSPISPQLIYGCHKAMMEVAIATMSNRGEIDGVSVRLPGILARPKGPSGMKSAFMSDLFHALPAGEHFTCPTSSKATIWAQSVVQCARNLYHALSLDANLLPRTRAVTLPALRFTMGELAAEIARQAEVDVRLVRFEPIPALERTFGAYPPLATPAADAAGFGHDGSLAALVRLALARIARDAP